MLCRWSSDVRGYVDSVLFVGVSWFFFEGTVYGLFFIVMSGFRIVLWKMGLAFCAKFGVLVGR